MPWAEDGVWLQTHPQPIPMLPLVTQQRAGTTVLFILVKSALNIKPGTLEGTGQMLIALEVGQKETHVGENSWKK